MSMIENLETVWCSIVGENTPPISHSLKSILKSNWIRFHSLPNSKRYPENIEDENEILNRHNCVLDSIFKNGDSVFVIQCVWSDERNKPEKPKGKGVFWKSWVIDSDGLEYVLGHAYAKSVKYKSRFLNDLILLVAHDRESNIMIVGERRKVVYAPYDGGMDLIITDSEMLNELRTIHSTFLSTHPDGL